MASIMKVATLIVLSITMAGCSDKPGNSLVEESVIEIFSNDHIAITDVDRVNGYIDGDGDYAVDVKYTAMYKDGYQNVIDRAGAFERMALEIQASMKGKWKKVDTYIEEETIYFIESENGWKLL